MSEFVRATVRRKPCKSLAFYAAWNRAHGHCAACGRDGGAFGLSTHHIVKQGRAHEATNLLRLCVHPCHDLAEGLDVRGPAIEGIIPPGIRVRSPGPLLPKITIGIALSMKLRCDPSEVDMARLQELRGSRLPGAEPIPEFFERLYRANRAGASA